MANANEKLSVGFLFDDTLDSNDGVSQQVKRLGEWLNKKGHKVSYFCGETELEEYAGGKVYSLAKNIKVKFNGNRLSMPLFSRKSAIKHTLETEDLDVLHVMAPYSPLLAQRTVALADKRCIAIVGSFHILPSGFVSAIGSRILGYLQYFSLKRFRAFTSTSKNAAIFAKETMGIDSCVVPNMVDVAKFKHVKNDKKVPGRIVFLGRLVSRKGCKQLIEAFSILVGKMPSAELVIAGDGEMRQQLEQLANQLGIAAKVQFLGFIKEEEKAGLLASATVACFPALYGESFGVVLIEAMAAGSGVVLAGDNPGYRCVMEEQPSLLVDPTKKEVFARKLYSLLTNAAQRQQYHEWQEQHVRQYDVDVVGKQMLSVYAKAIAKRGLTKDN